MDKLKYILLLAMGMGTTVYAAANWGFERRLEKSWDPQSYDRDRHLAGFGGFFGENENIELPLPIVAPYFTPETARKIFPDANKPLRIREEEIARRPFYVVESCKPHTNLSVKADIPPE